MSARRRWWLVLTGVGLAVTLAAPWFSWSKGPSSLGFTSRDLGLFAELYCSDFAKDAVECRLKWVGSEASWSLLPIFSAIRLVAPVALVLALLAIGRAVWRPDERARRWLAGAAVTVVLAVGAVFAVAPADRQFQPYGVAWGGGLAVIAAMSLFVAALPPRRRDRPALTLTFAAGCILVAALWSPWFHIDRAPTSDSVSAHAVGTLHTTRYWKPSGRDTWVAVKRRHTIGDRLKRPALRKVGKHLPYYVGLGTALAGLLMATALLRLVQARGLMRDDEDDDTDWAQQARTARRWALGFGLSGVTFAVLCLVHRRVQYASAGTTPDIGLALAVLGIAATLWGARQLSAGRPPAPDA